MVLHNFVFLFLPISILFHYETHTQTTVMSPERAKDARNINIKSEIEFIAPQRGHKHHHHHHITIRERLTVTSIGRSSAIISANHATNRACAVL
uniref:Putative secreted protein n=1 Tax=Anopheles darlingi TaxID=43151 RepID=A0A2M4DAP9_ANODA